ncbi:S9 family peptidase [Bacillus marinisedimentorum]|uniref:S9 family peptidase n=1 Tax=Bacillus marinisedimentorum TaxID=1821260 RepID=UPI0007DF8505|nr:S9 family peptidase [Bacillus marinisedimentorum]
MTKNFTAEDLYQFKFVSDPVISPDGKKAVYVKKEINDEKKYQSHLHMIDLDSKEDIQWTSGASLDSAPKWSPDGKSVAFVSNRSEQNQIWLISAAGGEAKQLTFCKNGAGSPVWMPDAKGLLFSTSLADDESIEETESKEKEDEEKKPLVIEQLRYKADGVGFLENTYEQIGLLNLADGSVRQLTEGAYDHESAAISADGKKLAYVRRLEEAPDRYMRSDVFVMNLRDGSTVKMNQFEGSFLAPAFSPDSNSLAFLGHDFEFEGATIEDVFVADLEGGEPANLTKEADLVPLDVNMNDLQSGQMAGLEWSENGEGLYFLGSERGNTHVFYVKMDGSLERVAGGTRQVYGLSIHHGQNRAVLAVNDPETPGDLFSIDLKSGEEERLTGSNEGLLNGKEISVPETFDVETEDGFTVQCWMMKPAGYEEGKQYPMVLEIHGGPHMMYGNTFFHEMQVLASKGYAVLFTNPRGSQGYGQKFVNANRSDYGGGDFRDLMTAVDQALERYSFIDRDQLFVTGGSYGGFMTNWIVGHDRRFKAAVTQRSISNWHSFYGVSDIGYFFTKWEVGSTVFEDPGKLWDQSPIKYVKNIETPLLILHSENDLRCPIEQGEQLFIALKHQGKDTRFVRFPGADHNLSRSGDPQLRVARLEEICGWFERYRA